MSDHIVKFYAMSPEEFKSGGKGLQIHYGFHESPFGKTLIALTSRGICYLAFVDTPKKESLDALKKEWPHAEYRENKEATQKQIETLFFSKSKKRITVHCSGTPFQLKVWEALIRVPMGFTHSYSDLAQSIGAPKSQRAVGSAVAKNKIALLIPCHRIIRENGEIGQYRWGHDLKQKILDLEKD